MTRTARFSRRGGVGGQRVGRFRSCNRKQAAHRQRCESSSQDLDIHFRSPLIRMITRIFYSSSYANGLISIKIDVRKADCCGIASMPNYSRLGPMQLQMISR
jgi:hypothetical protein